MNSYIPSFWGLFWQADFVVKSVILSLVGASFWSWSIVFSKFFLMRQLREYAEKTIDRGVRLNFTEQDFVMRQRIQHDPFAEMLDIASVEMKNYSFPLSSKQKDWVLFRLGQLMSLKVDEWREYLFSQVGILASIGSMAPFIGLFGTVWGIMNSFQSIACSKTTSLAVVGPGIAEALFATAIGLLVAIPAVIAYNRLSLSIQSYLSRLENFSQEVILECLTLPEEK